MRVYSLRTKEALDFYASTVYPRHLDNFGLFGVEAHGLWTQKDDVANRIFVLVSYAEGDDPGEVSILYDNLKSAVLERHGDAIRFHPALLDFAGHYRYDPRPVAIGRGNEKGRVERAPSRYCMQAAGQTERDSNWAYVELLCR
jgi:hypothetical protein